VGKQHSKNILKSFLSGEPRYAGIGLDIIGDIAILKLPESVKDEAGQMAQSLLEEIRNIKVVFRQTSPVSGSYRTRALEWLVGEKRTTTMHREHGCVFEVDVGSSYFSPRLSYERLRIASLVQEREKTLGRGEVVLNMFSGVGCFSIVIARRSTRTSIFSIDLNPNAIRYMIRNIWLNRVRRKVTAVLGDASIVSRNLFSSRMDRVLMLLPEKAYELLGTAVDTIRDRGLIHYYDFVHARRADPAVKVIEKVSAKLGSLPVEFKIGDSRVVRSVGPNWYQVALDIEVIHR